MKLFSILLLLMFAAESYSAQWAKDLRVSDPLMLKEFSGAVTPTAGYGSVYAKAADNNLYFMDSLGNEFNVLLGVGATIGLNYLSDVDVTTASPTAGQALVYDGAVWVPGNISSTLGALSDVDLITVPPTANKVLGFDGTKWVPATGGKTLIAGQGVTIDQDATTATISSAGKTLVGSAPIVVTQDANTATISFDDTKAKQFGGAIEVPTFIDNGGGNVTVNSLMVNLWNNATFAGDAQRYTVGALTATLADNVTSYIVADYNAGSPILRVTTDVNEITESSVVPIFTVFRSGAVLHTLDWDTLGRGLANKLHQSIVKTDRYRRGSGLAISESGTRNIDVTSGVIWVGANKVLITSIASLTDNIYYFLRTGASAWTTTSVTQYNNTQFWNGTTNATLTNGRYAVNWLFRGVESQKHLYMVIGEGDYTLAQAQASQPPTNLPAQITSHGLLVGRIIVVKNGATATQIDSAFNIVFTQSAASIHNDLGGLQGGTASEYYHLTQGKFNAVENLTASGTQTNFTGDVQSASCVYYGDSVTNGSHRSCQVGGALIYEKRVSGSWLETYRVE